jgi:hypothetical protein
MTGSSPAQRLADNVYEPSAQPFLATHRALSACSREFGRLTDEAVQRATALHAAAGVEEKLTVRQSPSRCIVQLGPVALTIAWLRSRSDVVAHGELLVIVWRGAVARREARYTERPTWWPTPTAATLVWESVLTPAAASEVAWTWQATALDGAEYSSPELAACCVDQLRLAYVESQESANDASAVTITNIP